MSARLRSTPPNFVLQRFENLDGEGNKRFYLQYAFPPFSVGEVGRLGTPGRREVRPLSSFVSLLATTYQLLLLSFGPTAAAYKLLGHRPLLERGKPPT
eukprot:6194645-Pleurochrysis_carterae.AAC.1